MPAIMLPSALIAGGTSLRAAPGFCAGGNGYRLEPGFLTGANIPGVRGLAPGSRPVDPARHPSVAQNPTRAPFALGPRHNPPDTPLPLQNGRLP